MRLGCLLSVSASLRQGFGPVGLLVVVFYLHGLQVFGIEDLAAVQALDVVHSFTTGYDLGTGMVTSGKHKQRFR